MHHLILWRHAEAGDGYPDSDRKLTERGLRQAQKVANWLNERLPEQTHILVSPAMRTQQTARALGCPVITCPEIAPGANASMVLEYIQWPAQPRNLLLIGHQPVLGDLVALLTSQSHGLWLRKGAIVWLRCKKHTENITLHVAISPELI